MSPCTSWWNAWQTGGAIATLHGEPRNGTYRVLDTVLSGEEIHLPEPFDLTPGTAESPVPPLR
ncbi:hypothetical protein BJP40_15155 [Streptomyces sp. CC53]|uniref:hypothetical protein n=1 Tax=unclassified Streptomyces TaxID=2593676 RepID=UPI0008DC9438|nr:MULTISPECIES: hypothetical protein [unclassified Streptomyces]OII65913.1 hypothetical protein BJP40_15155 [Streptomyces sp. CC53]